MRKLKLLLATLALLVGWASPVSAQKDVTSQYITNATLSDGTNGWTKTHTKTTVTQDPADAFSNSVRGNNTVGYASEAYAGYNSLIQTAYSMKQTITLPAGNYTLVCYAFFRQGDANDADHNSVSKAYLKAGSNNVLLKSLRSITATGYANSQAEGANAFDSKMYRNTLDFTIDADGTSIEIGVDGTFDEARSWCIVGQFELIDNNTPATMDAPFDVTGYITNPGFEYRDMTGWTQSSENFFGTQNNSQGFKVGGYYAEKWQASGALPAGSMSQTLTDLPAGYYKLTANLGGDGTYIDLNGKTASWTADKDYTVGYVLAENEPLTITAGKTAEGTANWIHFDNFRLQFCGDVVAALTTLLGEVTNYDGKIPTAAYQLLQYNVAQYNKNYSDVDELLAAIDAVQALYENADALKTPYSTWLTLKAQALTLANNHQTITGMINKVAVVVEKMTTVAQLNQVNANTTNMIVNYSAWYALLTSAGELVQVSSDDADAKATLVGVISEKTQAINTAAQNISDSDVDTQEKMAAAMSAVATLIDNIATYTGELKAAMTTYVKTAEPTDGECFDLTFLIVNPHFTEGTAAEPTGWTATWPNHPTGGWGGANELRIATHNFEAYHKAFELSQTIADLPKGTYKVTLQGFARHDDNGPTDKTNLFCGIVNQPFMNITDEYSTTALTAGKPALGDPNGESSYQLGEQTVYQPNGMSGSYYFFQETNPATNKPFYTNEVQTLITQDGDLTIGFKCETWSDWVIWDNFHLYYYGSAIAVTIDENKGVTFSENIENANVTLKRTFSTTNWNTFCVPFDIDNTTLKTKFGDDVQVAQYSEEANSEDNSTVDFTIVDSESAVISANTPVLLKTTKEDTSFTFGGVTIVAADEAKVEGAAYYDFVGTYAAETYIAVGDYFINSNKLYRAEEENKTKIKGTRAYIKAKEEATEARVINFFVDGVETTNIEGLTVAGAGDGKIYNLNGQEVKTPKKGLYIQNGKKISIK